jgi:hypothetical protein
VSGRRLSPARHARQRLPATTGGAAWPGSGSRRYVSTIDFASRCLNTGARGVRTRGLDIKAGAAKLKADRAARAEAEAVIQRWNDQLSRGRDMLWSPTIRAALLAETPWLDVFCPGCGTSRAIDLRTLDRHPLASVGTWCLGCDARGVLGRRRCRSSWASSPCHRPGAKSPLYEDPSLDFFFLGQVLGDFVYFLLLLF